MIKVKHTANKFIPNIKSNLYVLWNVGFFKKAISFKFKATKDVLRTDGDTSWMKIYGVKSSVVTTTNSESLAVYRTNKKGNLETAFYYRDGESQPDDWYVLGVIEHDFRTEGDVFKREFTIRRRWKEWIPCTPWAGGKIAPDTDIEYEIEKINKLNENNSTTA